jgi:hypothetical protein
MEKQWCGFRVAVISSSNVTSAYITLPKKPATGPYSEVLEFTLFPNIHLNINLMSTPIPFVFPIYHLEHDGLQLCLICAQFLQKVCLPPEAESRPII